MNVREAESLAARRAYATSTSVEPNAWANYQVGLRDRHGVSTSLGR